MAIPVVTVASGGIPVVEVTNAGMAVTESTSGLAVTKVTGGKPGLGVTYVSPTGGPAVSYVTWDPATVTAVTLSGNNFIATNTGTTSADQGARVATASGKTSGKYYIEYTFTSFTGSVTRLGVGIGPTGSNYTFVGSPTTSGVMILANGSINANGSGNLVDIITGSFPNGTVVGMAIDLDNRTAWFRQAPTGSWNAASGTANDPATNTGGVTIPAGTMVPFCTFGGAGGTSGNITTVNFGASAFSGAVPSGFIAGWPI